MWQITIPIPNWTGFAFGFFVGFIVGIGVIFAIAWWGNRRAAYRKAKARCDAARTRVEEVLDQRKN